MGDGGPGKGLYQRCNLMARAHDHPDIRQGVGMRSPAERVMGEPPAQGVDLAGDILRGGRCAHLMNRLARPGAHDALLTGKCIGCPCDRRMQSIGPHQVYRTTGGIILNEIAESPWRCPPKGINRLARIPDDHQAAGPQSELFQKAVLKRVDILEFVNQDVLPGPQLWQFHDLEDEPLVGHTPLVLEPSQQAGLLFIEIPAGAQPQDKLARERAGLT